MSVVFRRALERCEENVRRAEVNLARRELLALDWPKCPRSDRLLGAALCRRTGLVQLGLRALAPVVRGLRGTESRREVDPTPAESAEYGVLLQRAGAVPEALRVLGGVDVAKAPEALLYRAFCLFNVWDYEASIAPLSEFQTRGDDPYLRLVARVNRLAALAAIGRHQEAVDEFDSTVTLARNLGAVRLAGNCHEILAQTWIATGEWTKAEEALGEARRLLPEIGTLEGLFVAKWKAVLVALRDGELARLVAFRELAARQGDWESVRESDLFALKASYEPALHERLHFGTPFTAYRERAVRELGRSVNATSVSFGVGGFGAPTLNLISPEQSFPVAFGSGGQTHRALVALVSDQYRPQSLGGLFSALWPGDHFDPFSSPDRVHQVIRRLRRWLSQNSFPAEIVQFKGRWRLDTTGPLLIRVDGAVEALSAEQALLRSLESAVGGRAFSAKEARTILGLSESGFQRWAVWALENGRASRFGAGPATRYALAA